jgi:hypothetical protein
MYESYSKSGLGNRAAFFCVKIAATQKDCVHHAHLCAIKAEAR